MFAGTCYVPSIDRSSDVTSEHSNYWSASYKSAQRSGLQGWGNALIDRNIEHVARRFPRTKVLEVGASSGEHFALVSRDGYPVEGAYVSLDLAPGLTDPTLAKRLACNPQLSFISGDVQSMPFGDESFDQVISTCLFAHVVEPEKALAEVRRVTLRGGSIILGLPADPGLANRAIKQLVTYRSMRRAGVSNPRLSYAREHRNSISNLLTLIRHVFRQDHLREHYFPFRFPSWNLNLAVTVEIVRR